MKLKGHQYTRKQLEWSWQRIRESLAAGMSIRKTARAVGVDKTTVQRLKRADAAKAARLRDEGWDKVDPPGHPQNRKGDPISISLPENTPEISRNGLEALQAQYDWWKERSAAEREARLQGREEAAYQPREAFLPTSTESDATLSRAVLFGPVGVIYQAVSVCDRPDRIGPEHDRVFRSVSYRRIN